MTDLATSHIPNAEEQKARLTRELIERWEAFAPSLDQYRWPLERGRWSELVFCLLRRSARSVLDAEDARRTAQILDALDLVDIPRLALCVTERGEVDLSGEDAKLGLAILTHSGLSAEQAEAAWVTLAEAAAALQRNYGGKLQRYLRSYGERMLAELGEHFRFSRLDESEAANAFTLWLQNALDMPLLLAQDAVERAVLARGVTRRDLIDVADELELNLAVVDDMLESTGPAEEPND